MILPLLLLTVKHSLLSVVEFLVPSQVRKSRWRLDPSQGYGVVSCFSYFSFYKLPQATASLCTCVLVNNVWWPYCGLRLFFSVRKKNRHRYLCPWFSSKLSSFRPAPSRTVFALSPIFLLSAQCRPMEFPYPLEFLTSLNNCTTFPSSTFMDFGLPFNLNISGIYPDGQIAK